MSAPQRLERVLNQIAPSHTASSSPNFDPPSLRLLASQNHYGELTIGIINEFRKCLQSPDDQLIFDSKLFEALNTNKLATNPNLHLLDDESILKGSISQRHSHDRSHFDPIPSVCIIYPLSAQEVSDVVKICNTNRIPVHPCGTRTGLEGGSLSLIPGVTLDMTRMNRVLNFIENEQLLEVQPGIEKIVLQKWLKERGYYFPVDPGSNAAIGGYANTNASGTFMDSNMTKYVRCMEIVTANGDIMTTRTRAAKTSAGYNLQGIIIGSEGTLCVITKIVLQVRPIPKTILSACIQFPTSRDVTNFVVAIKQSGYTALTRAELLNEQAIEAVNLYAKTTFEIKPTLIIECHLQNDTEVPVHETMIKGIAEKHNYLNYRATANEKEYDQIWSARKDALFAAYKLFKNPSWVDKDHKPRVAVFVTDICVPMPFLPDILDITEKDFANANIPCPIAGHVGDGNFHCLIPYDTKDKKQVDIITTLNARMLRAAIKLGGSITGEHGVGMGKMPFLEEERGPVAMKMMRDIKRALDPNCIMNPFKVFIPYVCEDHGHGHNAASTKSTTTLAANAIPAAAPQPKQKEFA